MESTIETITIDGFRFINNLNTTARQLFICSEIVIKLGGKQLPKELLSQMLVKWSKTQELENDIYKNSKGKLSDNQKETSALKHYLDLSDFLGLITHLNNFYANSRLAYLLLYTINLDMGSENRTGLMLGEKLFYLFQLFTVDADGLIFILSQLSKEKLNQKDLQKNFKDAFNARLLSKKDLASDIVKNQIGEKYRTVNFVWKNSEKYSEHLLIPRCEWLRTLGLIDIERKGNFTIYSLNEKGSYLYNSLPTISNNSEVKDVNETWIHNKLFPLYNELFCGGQYKLFSSLNSNERTDELGSSLEKAITIIKTSGSFRIPLYDSVLFVCLYMFLEKQIVVNFSNIFDELKSGLVFKRKQYILKEAGRINEGYITTRIEE